MAMLLFVTAFSFILPQIDQHRHSFLIADFIRSSDAQTTLGSYGHINPSLIFYGNRTISSYYDSKAVATFLSRPHAVLITTDQRYGDIVDVVPSQMKVLAEAPRYFKREKWILVGLPPMTGKLDDDEPSRR